MSAVFIDEDGKLQYDPWVVVGTMMYNRECLSLDDPNQLYNYLVSNGVEPETYGIHHPSVVEFKDFTRSQLIKEITQLRGELMSYRLSGF